MELLKYKEAIVRASITCLRSKIDIDIFEKDGLFAVKESHLRNSVKFKNRISYEKGKTIVRDAEGKVCHSIDTAKTKKRSSKKQKSENTKQEEDKSIY